MPADPDILLTRLRNQQILAPPMRKPADVVSRLCAMQAQDYPGVLWSVGLRMQSATMAGIRQSLAEGQVIRTWLLRGTLHLTTPEDVRWILRLTGPRVIAGNAGRHRQLGLSADDFTRSREVLKRELEGGGALTRDEVFRALGNAGISTEGQRGYHLLAGAGLSGLICFGAPRGKQQTFVLLDEWAPEEISDDKDDPAARLAGRYFEGHGPALPEDFAWWSGLSLSAARAGIKKSGSRLVSFTAGGREYFEVAGEDTIPAGSRGNAVLLPGFDEYIVGYRNRSDIISPEPGGRGKTGGNGMMLPVLVVDGSVAGTWRREAGTRSIIITLKPFQDSGTAQRYLIEEAAERYGRFVELPISVRW